MLLFRPISCPCVSCLATVLGAVKGDNTANRGNCIQHVSACVSAAWLSQNKQYSNESHLLWKIMHTLLGMQTSGHKMQGGFPVSAMPHHTVAHRAFVVHSGLHRRHPTHLILFHHPETCSFSCISFYIWMQVNCLLIWDFDSGIFCVQ